MNATSKALLASWLGTGTMLAAHPALADEHPNLSGFWEARSGSVTTPQQPQWSPAGLEELKKPSKFTDPNGVDESDTNCLPLGQPWTLHQSAPMDIVHDEREITMIYEDRTLPWHIYLDGRPHPPASVLKLTLQGHSIGHWEGDELVVDSVGFAARVGHGALFMIANNDTTHVIERFSLAANGQELHGHFRIEDPKWLLKPHEYDVVWYRDPPKEYAITAICDARDPANGQR